MATIKDIAFLAGVSHGTVSNVINKRGNVSVDKIQLVEAASKKLGFSANAQAQRLRMNKSRHVAIIMPDIFAEQYTDLYSTLLGRLSEYRYEVSLHLGNSIPDTERACLADAMTLGPTNIIAISPSLSVQEYSDINIPAILVDAQPLSLPFNIAAMGINSEKALAEIVVRINTLGCKSVAFFGDSPHIPLDEGLESGLRKQLKLKGISLQCYNCNSKLKDNGAFELATSSRFDAIVTTNTTRVRALQNVYSLNNLLLPTIISLTSIGAVKQGSFSAYELDYPRMGIELADMLEDGTLPVGKNQVIIENVGFRFEFPFINPKKADCISLLTISSPTSEALLKLSPYFERLSGIKLKITMLPHDELYSTLNTIGGSNYDLIRMDMGWLTQLEQRLCMPLRPFLPALKSEINDFLPAVARLYCKPAQEFYTLPLDPSIQMLFYRKDLFEDATIRRLYYERNKGELALPASYLEFNRVAEFFTCKFNAKSPTEYGTALAYGMSAVAASDFLPRLRDMGGNIFDADGEFALDSPQVRNALENYMVSQQYAVPTINNWWGDTMKLFADGTTAMTTVFINHASQIISSHITSLIGRVGAAPVPGNMPLLGGGCIGISRDSHKQELCVEFLKWVYSEEVSTLITLLGGLSPCLSPYKNEQILDLYPWLHNIDNCFHTGHRHCSSTRYPQFDSYRFELLLGGHLRNMMTGVVDIDQMMQALNEDCRRQF